jgi:hypothetical protein
MSGIVHTDHCSCPECYERWASATGSYVILHLHGHVEVRRAVLCIAAFDGFITDLRLAITAACDWNIARLSEMGVRSDPVTNRITNSDDDNREPEERLEH